jgi:HAD superfamily hydrolase (TIGR01549 family)
MMKGVLFDIGETLLTNLESEKINQLILNEKGIKKTLKQIRTATGKAEKEFGKRHAGRKLLAMELDEFYIEWDTEVYTQLGLKNAKKLGKYAHKRWFEVAGLKAFDDAVPVLDRLSAKGLRLGVVTNGYHEEAKSVLSMVAVPENLFSVIVGRDTAMALKPDPRPFLHAAGSMGLRPDEVLFVGDDYVKDYEGAQGVGMNPVLLLRGKSVPPGTPKDINIVQTLDEIVNFIQ